MLDEPTNHPTSPRRDVGERPEGLRRGGLGGQPRPFRLPSRQQIVEIRDGELVVYRGDYAYYREKKAEEAAAAEAARQAAEQEAKRKAKRDKQKAKEAARKSAA